MIRTILSVFRPLRWYRNSFMLLGSIVAIAIVKLDFTDIYIHIGLAFISICLVASANYGINEILDVQSDSHHPKKKYNAIPSRKISVGLVLIVSIILYISGFLIILSTRNRMLIFSMGAFFISAILYNVRPFRLKDVPYLDFSFEAINNPIRLSVGWYAVTKQTVPASLLLVGWFFGIFLMASKRFGEIRTIGHSAQKYRRSFMHYSEKKLLIVMVAAINVFSYMLGVLTRKYTIDLVLFLPFMIGWLAWFFYLAYEKNTIVKDPERIFEKIPFLLYSVFVFILFMVLLFTKRQIFGFIP